MTGIVTGIMAGVAAGVNLVFTTVEFDCYVYELVYPHTFFRHTAGLVCWYYLYLSTRYCGVTFNKTVYIWGPYNAVSDRADLYTSVIDFLVYTSVRDFSVYTSVI